jgi:hypothetical protein
MVATAITLSAVSCNTKSGSQPADAAPDRVATTKRIFAALPAEEVIEGITPQQREQLLDSEEGITIDDVWRLNGYFYGRGNIIHCSVSGGEGGSAYWALACFFHDNNQDVTVVISSWFADAPLIVSNYVHYFRFHIPDGTLTPIDCPFPAFTEKELIADSHFQSDNDRKRAHELFKEPSSLIYFFEDDAVTGHLVGEAYYEDMEYGEIWELALPTINRVWNGKGFN